MKMKMKKFLSLLLVACALLTLQGFPASAGTVSTEATEVISAPSQEDLDAYVTANGTKTVTDVYNNCLLLTVENTTGSEWNTYRNLLVSEGYTEIVGKTAVLETDSKWALYATSDYVVNCFYDAVNKEAKISIEPRDMDLSVFTKPASVENVCEPMLIQMGLDDNTSTEQKDTQRSGMGYILRLADGRFIIYDGGFSDATLQNADKIYNIMKKYAPTSGTYANQVVIATWVLTHPHADHIGAFMEFTKYYIGYSDAPATLQTVICNLPSVASSSSDTNTVLGSDLDVDADKIDAYNKTLLALQDLGTHVYKAHVGQKYYFNEAVIEILFTAENFLPDQITALGSDIHGTNALSIVSRVTWECDAYTYSALFTGDANYYVIKELNSLYGANLGPNNFVQTPHHGSVSEFGEGTAMTALTQFYTYAEAYRTLMPAGVRYAYVNQCKTTTALYDDETRLIGYAQRAGNPTPNLKNIIIAGSDVTAFTLQYSTKKVVSEVLTGADFYATAPTLESTTVATKDGDVYLIYNEVGLSDLKPSRSSKLLKDMTITVIPGETTFPLLKEHFYGTFDGNGYSLVVRSKSAIGITLSSGDTQRGLLFNIIGKTATDADGAISDDQGTVKDLNIYCHSIAVNGSVGGQFGVIAAVTGGYSVIKNVTLTTTGEIVKESTVNANVGSMIGKALNGVQITDSAFVGSIANGLTDTTAFTAGGLIGCVDMREDDDTTTDDDALNRKVVIKNSTVNANNSAGYITGYTQAGGLIGAVTKNPVEISVSGTSVGGSVNATTNAGGAIGCINATATVTLNSVTNNAAVSAYHAGGLVGQSCGTGVMLTVMQCTNTGAVTSTGGVASSDTAGTAGGLMGYAINQMNVHVTAFVNSGDISVETANTARISAMFGRLGATSGDAPVVTVSGVTNSGTVSSGALYEGIWAGHISGASKLTTSFIGCSNVNTATANLKDVGVGNATSITLA